MSMTPSTAAIQLSDPQDVVLTENRPKSSSPPPTTVTYSANDESLPFDHARSSSPPPPAVTDSAGHQSELIEGSVAKHDGDGREDADDEVPSEFEADKPPPMTQARDRSPSQERTSSIFSDMETYLRTISVGTSSDPLTDQLCRFGDEWAAVGAFSGLQDLTYDEDLNFPSDIVINTSSIPETISDPSGSYTTPDTTDEVTTVEQNGDSQGKHNSLPYSDEYSDVYLDI